jgi:hypothetical protein
MSQKVPPVVRTVFSEGARDTKMTRVLSAEDIEFLREAGIDVDSPAEQRDPRLDDPNISQKRYRELRHDL